MTKQQQTSISSSYNVLIFSDNAMNYLKSHAMIQKDNPSKYNMYQLIVVPVEESQLPQGAPS